MCFHWMLLCVISEHWFIGSDSVSGVSVSDVTDGVQSLLHWLQLVHHWSQAGECYLLICHNAGCGYRTSCQSILIGDLIHCRINSVHFVSNVLHGGKTALWFYFSLSCLILCVFVSVTLLQVSWLFMTTHCLTGFVSQLATKARHI